MSYSCTVRPVIYDDLEMVWSWRNHPDVRRFMLTQHEISFDDHCDWFLNSSKDKRRCLLIVQEGVVPIGFVQFSNVSIGGVADWGFYAKPGSPKGVGHKLGLAALSYAFNKLHLHKVCGQAIEGNLASIAFHKKLGFIQEGFLRDQKLVNGKYHSLFFFGLIAYEWNSNQLLREEKNAKD